MELLAVSTLTVLVKMIAICRSLTEGKKKKIDFCFREAL